MALRVVMSALVTACAARSTEPTAPATRTHRMGFSSLPPRLTIPEVLRTVDSVTRHADGALMVIDVPWVALLADSSPAFLIRRDQFPLAQLFGQRGMPLTVTFDVTNGA
ncbi:MAG: hypothetical protein M3Z10_06615 [Gemmatimonadota bacterium]|nr:hypothetical protein [Gemmatimonadota bacterium]